jgi:two-component system, OmpR family, response regulator RpaB
MGSKGSILITEDDPVLRDVYVKKFTIAGFKIRTAENGQEALDAIKEESPDLMLLDINMPVLDGFGVLEKLPRSERKFPIILLTNFGDEKNRARGKELGADNLFVKREMTIKKLLEMVEGLLKAKDLWEKE